MILDDDYLYVANQGSNSVDHFLVHPETGIPAPTGRSLTTAEPMCLVLLLNAEPH